MMVTISEPDWKLYRPLHAVALERFSARVLSEINGIMADLGSSNHARFLEIAGLLDQRNRELDELFDRLRRSSAFTQLARWRSLELVTDEEFAQFGPQTRGAVEMFLAAWSG